MSLNGCPVDVSSNTLYLKFSEKNTIFSIKEIEKTINGKPINKIVFDNSNLRDASKAQSILEVVKIIREIRFNDLNEFVCENSIDANSFLTLVEELKNKRSLTYLNFNDVEIDAKEYEETSHKIKNYCSSLGSQIQNLDYKLIVHIPIIELNDPSIREVVEDQKKKTPKNPFEEVDLAKFLEWAFMGYNSTAIFRYFVHEFKKNPTIKKIKFIDKYFLNDNPQKKTVKFELNVEGSVYADITNIKTQIEHYTKKPFFNFLKKQNSWDQILKFRNPPKKPLSTEIGRSNSEPGKNLFIENKESSKKFDPLVNLDKIFDVLLSKISNDFKTCILDFKIQEEQVRTRTCNLEKFQDSFLSSQNKLIPQNLKFNHRQLSPNTEERLKFKKELYTEAAKAGFENLTVV